MCDRQTDISSYRLRRSLGKIKFDRWNFIYSVAKLRFMGFAPRESREIRKQLENLPAWWGRSPWRFSPLELGCRRGCDGDAVRSPEISSPTMGREGKRL